MNLTRFVVADLVRNPRRTLSTMVGVVLGVGLFCAVLFFVDGLSASMTQRAAAPLAIDIQRIVGSGVGNTIELEQRVDAGPDGTATVSLSITNIGDVALNEVTLRSVPGDRVVYLPGSAHDGTDAIDDPDGNPFAAGPGRTGLNVGTVAPGASFDYSFVVSSPSTIDASAVSSTSSSREAPTPVAANAGSRPSLGDLATSIGVLGGVDSALPLSIADLGSSTMTTPDRTASGPAKIFGFDLAYAGRDESIVIVAGALDPTGVAISAEAAAALEIGVGSDVSIALPDGSSLDRPVSAVVDLSRARSLFASRRGSDLETFAYTQNSVVVSQAMFADVVFPAFEQAAAKGDSRLKNPPVREVDVLLDRSILSSDPASAVAETTRVADAVIAISTGQDYLLDNISNTLDVAAADAEVAKRLFIFLGLPGALLAAMLAAYSGSVLAEAQRREQAILRIRGASRRHLLAMLATRTGILTAAGSIAGLALGYAATLAVLGRESLDRASTTSLLTSAAVGTSAGFIATGGALYVTGRRAIDRQIADDRARLSSRAPLWKRWRIDIIGSVGVVIATATAIRLGAFAGSPGSVYFGRSVELNLRLLVLPVGSWVFGSLIGSRLAGAGLGWLSPASRSEIGAPFGSLFRLSIGRRPWDIANGTVIVALIVALATSTAVFTASYDAAKQADARFATGSDVRITPAPTSQRVYEADDAGEFDVDGVSGVSPVIYSRLNVILRSDRTSDPADLAAVDPATFGTVAPVERGRGMPDLGLLDDGPVVVLDRDMAEFLQTQVGDTIDVLLARGTDMQRDVPMTIVGLFDQVPGFPNGVDALISIGLHTSEVPAKAPDFFIASTTDPSSSGLIDATAAVRAGPGSRAALQVESRADTLATDQSSLAALNVAGLIDLDSVFALGMAAIAIGIFVFGLLLQRRREYVTLRAQGLERSVISRLVTAEAMTVAIGGVVIGSIVGVVMGCYFVSVLQPLFVLAPVYRVPATAFVGPAVLATIAVATSAALGTRLINSLDPTELLRDE